MAGCALYLICFVSAIGRAHLLLFAHYRLAAATVGNIRLIAAARRAAGGIRGGV